MEARLTIANMTTEWGALVGWFPADAAAFEWLRARRTQLGADGEKRLPESELSGLEKAPPQADADAQYAARIVLDLGVVTPHISGPDTVQTMSSLADLEKQRVKIDKAYLVSCVNSRIEDLEAAAAVLRGKKVASTVKFYLAPASRWVQDQAERRGIWQTILDSGAIPLPAGCGPCIGLGTGLLEPGEIGISATNRNFKGRMGSREAQCYLASPAVVAASAVAGYICGPRVIAGGGESRYSHLERRFNDLSAGVKVAAEKVSILPGFPARVRGRLVFVPKDNLNTDAIYPGTYTYREDVTPEMMARVVMENYDPEFAAKTSPGDVLVGGFNFGSGSSREQAVTALKAKGIPLVIAGSFSQTYLRNAFNNGFLCIEVPKLVKRLRERLTAKEKTIIPGEEIEVDFTASTVTWGGDLFHFPALGSVPQSLVIAGGVERLVARKLGM
jgi:homoaconitate hydratase